MCRRQRRDRTPLPQKGCRDSATAVSCLITSKCTLSTLTSGITPGQEPNQVNSPLLWGFSRKGICNRIAMQFVQHRGNCCRHRLDPRPHFNPAPVPGPVQLKENRRSVGDQEVERAVADRQCFRQRRGGGGYWWRGIYLPGG